MANADIEITYQGKPCINVQFNLNTGTLADIGYVDIVTEKRQVITRDQANGEIPVPAGPPTQLRTTVIEDAGVDPLKFLDPLIFDQKGELVLWDQGHGNRIVLKNIYVAKEGITQITIDEQPLPSFAWRINLTDFRHLWAKRGIVEGNFNVSSEELPDWGPATLRQLVETCLARLNCKLLRFPDTLSKLAPSVEWGRATYAQDALTDLATDIGFVVAPTNDDDPSVRIYSLYEWSQINKNNVPEIVFAAILSSPIKITKAWFYRHKAGIVYSKKRKQKEIMTFDLEPVIEWDGSGRDHIKGDLVNLWQALDTWGYDTKKFLKAILVQEKAQERSFKDLKDKDKLIEAIRRKILQHQGMKWFRVPDESDKLPMLKSRQTINEKTGRLSPAPILIRSALYAPLDSKDPGKAQWGNFFLPIPGVVAPSYDYDRGILKFKRPMGVLVPLIRSVQEKKDTAKALAEADEAAKAVRDDKLITLRSNLKDRKFLFNKKRRELLEGIEPLIPEGSIGIGTKLILGPLGVLIHERFRDRGGLSLEEENKLEDETNKLQSEIIKLTKQISDLTGKSLPSEDAAKMSAGGDLRDSLIQEFYNFYFDQKRQIREIVPDPDKVDRNQWARLDKLFDELSNQMTIFNERMRISNPEECILIDPVIQVIYATEENDWYNFRIGSPSEAFKIDVNWIEYDPANPNTKSNADNLNARANALLGPLLNAAPNIVDKAKIELNSFVRPELDGAHNSIQWDSDGNTARTTILRNDFEQPVRFRTRARI